MLRRRSGVFIANFDNTSYPFLFSVVLTLNKEMLPGYHLKKYYLEKCYFQPTDLS